ncbi:hypothetical protein FGB62_185g05 [Gracilaria domingensis]|nr:hypothetical protein FGB62_185g05 [Gracilaria domingensis]
MIVVDSSPAAPLDLSSSWALQHTQSMHQKRHGTRFAPHSWTNGLERDGPAASEKEAEKLTHAQLAVSSCSPLRHADAGWGGERPRAAAPSAPTAGTAQRPSGTRVAQQTAKSAARAPCQPQSPCARRRAAPNQRAPRTAPRARPPRAPASGT